jgi:hypothetical protein
MPRYYEGPYWTSPAQQRVSPQYFRKPGWTDQDSRRFAREMGDGWYWSQQHHSYVAVEDGITTTHDLASQLAAGTGNDQLAAQFWVGAARLVHDTAAARVHALHAELGLDQRRRGELSVTERAALHAAENRAATAGEVVTRAAVIADYGVEAAGQVAAELEHHEVARVYDYLHDPDYYAQIEADPARQADYVTDVSTHAHALVAMGYTAGRLRALDHEHVAGGPGATTPPAQWPVEQAWRQGCRAAYTEYIIDYGNDGHPENDRTMKPAQQARFDAAVREVVEWSGASEGMVRGHMRDAAYLHGQDPGHDHDPDRFAPPDWVLTGVPTDGKDFTPRTAAQIRDYLFSQLYYDSLTDDAQRVAYLDGLTEDGQQLAAGGYTVEQLQINDAVIQQAAKDSDRDSHVDDAAGLTGPDNPDSSAAARRQTAQQWYPPALSTRDILGMQSRPIAVDLLDELDQARAQLEAGDIEPEREHELVNYIEHLQDRAHAAATTAQQAYPQDYSVADDPEDYRFHHTGGESLLPVPADYTEHPDADRSGLASADTESLTDDERRALAHLRGRTTMGTFATGLDDWTDERWTSALDGLTAAGYPIQQVHATGADDPTVTSGWVIGHAGHAERAGQAERAGDAGAGTVTGAALPGLYRGGELWWASYGSDEYVTAGERGDAGDHTAGRDLTSAAILHDALHGDGPAVPAEQAAHADGQHPSATQHTTHRHHLAGDGGDQAGQARCADSVAAAHQAVTADPPRITDQAQTGHQHSADTAVEYGRADQDHHADGAGSDELA